MAQPKPSWALRVQLGPVGGSCQPRSRPKNKLVALSSQSWPGLGPAWAAPQRGPSCAILDPTGAHTHRQTGRQAGRRQTARQPHMHTHTVCVHIHTYVRTYVRTYIYIYVYGTSLQPPPPIHFLICMYIHLSIVVRMHACTCANGHNTYCTRPYPDRHAHIEYPHRMYIARQMYPNILCPQIYVHLTYVPVYMYIHTPKCQPLSTSYE